MTEEKKKIGGARPGAGRPSKAGCPTVVMRVPASAKDGYELLIRMTREWTDFCNKIKQEITLDKAEEEARAKLVKELKDVIAHEEKRARKAKKKAQEEEDNKRQMKLFPDEKL